MEKSNLNVLGISCYYHDSAAVLLKEGSIVAAVEEERFTRKKHDNSFPSNAVNYCLEKGDLEEKDVDYVVFHEKPVTKFMRILQTFVDVFPRGFKFFRESMPDWVNRKLVVRSEIQKNLEEFDGKILFSKHHLSHASAAFHPSPFEEAAIVTLDGVGEWTTTGISKGKDKKIETLKKIDFPHSIGLLYSTVTSFLGFMVNNDEYKIMGLASYGEPVYEQDLKENVVYLKEDGSYELNMDYFSFRSSQKMWSQNFEELLGKPRQPDAKITKRDKDLAASLQKITEELVLNIVERAHELTDQKNLCMSGGVALNSSCNGMLRKKSSFEKIWVQPAATDAGDALGAATYLYNHVLDKKRIPAMNHVYLGPGFSNDEIKKTLDEQGANYRRMEDQELVEEVSSLLEDFKVVSWFQGRMEWGPRALGNRSILGNPKKQETMDIINKKVKHREDFRPFAPSVLEEKAEDYFDITYQSPYMLFVFDVKQDKRNEIPAVTHVNGTSRIQTVDRKTNPLYHRLIERFGEKTGTPVVLNTSFNVKGEPIVLSPKDAYRCFSKTGIDHMAIGNYLVNG